MSNKYAFVVKWISRWSTEPLFWVRVPADAPKKSALIADFFITFSMIEGIEKIF